MTVTVLIGPATGLAATARSTGVQDDTAVAAGRVHPGRQRPVTEPHRPNARFIPQTSSAWSRASASKGQLDRVMISPFSAGFVPVCGQDGTDRGYLFRWPGSWSQGVPRLVPEARPHSAAEECTASSTGVLARVESSMAVASS